MPQPPAAPNKKRQRMILIGAAAAGLLLLLYLRSRSAASSPNATSPTDVQGAYMQGAQAQAQQDAALGGAAPSTFADNGANAAALGDALTQGLGDVTTALQGFENTPPSWYTAPGNNGTSGSGSTSTAPPPPPPPITINVNQGGSVGTGTKSTPNTQPVTNPYAATDKKYLGAGVEAPKYALTPPKGAPAAARWYGTTRPKGNWTGIGGGWWKPGAKK